MKKIILILLLLLAPHIAHSQKLGPLPALPTLHKISFGPLPALNNLALNNNNNYAKLEEERLRWDKIIEARAKKNKNERKYPAGFLLSDTLSQFVWPTSNRRVTKDFTFRHTAIDIDGQNGDPIYATAAGIIQTAQWDNRGYHGYYIVIGHNNNVVSLYAHLSHLFVQVGNHVEKGFVIGKMGNTGQVVAGPHGDGSHLHFQIFIDGNAVNPLELIK